MSKLEQAIYSANKDGRIALAAFLTAGFPTKDVFAAAIGDIVQDIDVLEIGVPFSDPMADGVSIQHASHEALRQGVTLPWILELVSAQDNVVPVVLMSYLNPLLAFGFDRLAKVANQAGVSGLIIPDLPYEEAAPFHDVLVRNDVDLIQLVTPATPPERLVMICRFSRGFVYAVTMTGTTGGNIAVSKETASYLDRVRRISDRPVMAGFGIRKPEHILPLRHHTNGVIVGSALVDLMRDGEDPLPFVRALRQATLIENEVVK